MQPFLFWLALAVTSLCQLTGASWYVVVLVLTGRPRQPLGVAPAPPTTTLTSFSFLLTYCGYLIGTLVVFCLNK